jgi:hydrogenase nickel incorporation protein HypA/HybF
MNAPRDILLHIMHELTICLNLIRSLEQMAKLQPPPKIQGIQAVWLEIGILAGIDIEAIRFSFPIAAAHSIAKNATLHIETQEGLAYCQICQKNVIIDSLLTPCMYCKQYEYDIIQGKALRIIKMEVV